MKWVRELKIYAAHGQDKALCMRFFVEEKISLTIGYVYSSSEEESRAAQIPEGMFMSSIVCRFAELCVNVASMLGTRTLMSRYSIDPMLCDADDMPFYNRYMF